MSKNKMLKSGLMLCQITLASCFMICLSAQAAPTMPGEGCNISDNARISWPVDGSSTNRLEYNVAEILLGAEHFGGTRRSCYFRTEAELTNPDSTCDLATPEVIASPETAYIALINYSSLKYCAYKYEVDFAATDRRFSGAVVSSLPPAVRAPILNFEEPIDGRTSNGIANVRGWIVSDSAITRIDLYVDGVLLGAIPHGGIRPLVGDTYPTFPNSDKSGFSMAYGFSNFTRGTHTMEVKVYDAVGLLAEKTNTFFVSPFDSAFIGPLAPVDLSGVSFIRPNPEDSATILKRFRMNNAVIDGLTYDLLFEWNSATQKFEIIDVF